MTDPKNRAAQRAVRQYQRNNPGTTLREARDAVAARAGEQDALPEPIAGCPSPAPGEQLAPYVRRVADQLGIGRHRAMELLGLEPGDSASARLDELAGGLDERTLRKLQAATGRTGELVWLALGELKTGTAAELFPRIRRGGQDKTRLTVNLAATLAQHGQRALLVDLDHQPGALPWAPREAVGEPASTVLPPLFLDLPPALPVLPVVDEVWELLTAAETARLVRASEVALLVRQPAGPRRGHLPAQDRPGADPIGGDPTPPAADRP